jgi:membrane dipeptidase
MPMLRRNFLAQGLTLAAAPLVFAWTSRAAELVRRTNVIDMLGLITLDWPLLDRWQCDSAAFSEADFRRLRDSGIDVFHPAVAFDGDCTFDLTRSWFAKWNNLIERHPQYFLRIDTAEDLQRARRDGKTGIVLGMQDANHLRTKADVDAFYALGQRLTQLTYNGTNRLGNGCLVARDGGLSPYGQEIVARMNEIGMAIDISHCGERTSLDAIEASNKPVLITHSNCRALANVARCKSDAVIRAAARKGGVIGMTGVRRFVRSSGPVSMEDALNHFDHAVRLVGVEHVGLGSDTDLHGRGPAGDIEGLNHATRVYELTEGLIRRGYSDSDIALMLGGNFERALTETWRTKIPSPNQSPAGTTPPAGPRSRG